MNMQFFVLVPNISIACYRLKVLQKAEELQSTIIFYILFSFLIADGKEIFEGYHTMSVFM